jgi:sulfur carrier protein
MIRVFINGEEREIESDTTVLEFLQRHDLNPKTLVVEHNREILPRDRYAQVLLTAGDEVEIVRMMAGG